MPTSTNMQRQMQQLSRGRGPAVHRYYDVPAESPDATRILYTEFDTDAIPGPATVIVARADGSEPMEVGRCEHAIGHVGANPMWLDDQTIAFCPQGPNTGHTLIRSLAGAADELLEGQIRSFHEGRQLGALLGAGCHAHGFAWACEHREPCSSSSTGNDSHRCVAPPLAPNQPHAHAEPRTWRPASWAGGEPVRLAMVQCTILAWSGSGAVGHGPGHAVM